MKQFFWNSLAFSMIQRMLAIWSLVPLPFLNLGCIFGSSQFTYCQSLDRRILSITLLVCEVDSIVQKFRKGRGTRDQIANIRWIIEKAREFQKNIFFIDYAKDFDWMYHNKLWKILKEMGIPDHLTCLLKNLYAGQEATVRTGHWKMDWFKIGKGVYQACVLSPCLFNLYAEYIMQNTGLDELQTGIKTAGRNINNLRYEDDTTLMAQSEEELNSLLTRVK